jgi:hypothetical protein
MTIISRTEHLVAKWTGPYSWPNFENDNGLPSLPKHTCGVYLQTVEFQDGGYLIYLAGHAKDIRVRYSQHEKKRREGDQINVFDIDLLKHGQRVLVWNGFTGWWKSNALPERLHEREAALGLPIDWGTEYPDSNTRKREAFHIHRAKILDATLRQCCDFRIFIAEFGPDDRLRKRLEAGIMDSLAVAPLPFSSIPDKGMALSRRDAAKGEFPITVRNVADVTLHALPSLIEI